MASSSSSSSNGAELGLGLPLVVDSGLDLQLDGRRTLRSDPLLLGMQAHQVGADAFCARGVPPVLRPQRLRLPSIHVDLGRGQPTLVVAARPPERMLRSRRWTALQNPSRRPRCLRWPRFGPSSPRSTRFLSTLWRRWIVGCSCIPWASPRDSGSRSPATLWLSHGGGDVSRPTEARLAALVDSLADFGA